MTAASVDEEDPRTGGGQHVEDAAADPRENRADVERERQFAAGLQRDEEGVPGQAPLGGEGQRAMKTDFFGA